MSKAESESELECREAEQLRLLLECSRGRAEKQEFAESVSELAALAALTQVAQKEWTHSAGSELRAELLAHAESQSGQQKPRTLPLMLLRRSVWAVPMAAVALLALRVFTLEDDSRPFSRESGLAQRAELSPVEVAPGEDFPGKDVAPVLHPQSELLRAQSLSLARRAQGEKSEVEDAALELAWREYRGRLIAELERER